MSDDSNDGSYDGSNDGSNDSSDDDSDEHLFIIFIIYNIFFISFNTKSVNI
jgi:hypothetical protein